MSRRKPEGPVVATATDPKRARKARRTAKQIRAQELSDLRELLATPAGQRVMRRILDQVGTFRSIWHASAAIHFNAGQQDVGHWLLTEIGEADKAAIARIVTGAYTERETKDG